MYVFIKFHLIHYAIGKYVAEALCTYSDEIMRRRKMTIALVASTSLYAHIKTRIELTKKILNTVVDAFHKKNGLCP